MEINRKSICKLTFREKMIRHYFQMAADGELLFYYHKPCESGLNGTIWKVEMCLTYDGETQQGRAWKAGSSDGGGKESEAIVLGKVRPLNACCGKVTASILHGPN